MDNVFALEDIAPLMRYIDFPFTSNDTGYRKPNGEGLRILSERMGLPTREMAFVGDERKDVECAKNAGATAILINRTGERRDYGQDFEIRDLRETAGMIR